MIEPKYTQNQLEHSLEDFYEYEAEAIMGIIFTEFFLVGETLKSALNHKLTGDKIELGVRSNAIGHELSTAYQELLGMLKETVSDLKYSTRLISFTYGEEQIPYEIHIMPESPFFDYFASFDYMGDEVVLNFLIPNPVEGYLESISKKKPSNLTV